MEKLPRRRNSVTALYPLPRAQTAEDAAAKAASKAVQLLRKAGEEATADRLEMLLPKAFPDNL